MAIMEDYIIESLACAIKNSTSQENFFKENPEIFNELFHFFQGRKDRAEKYPHLYQIFDSEYNWRDHLASKYSHDIVTEEEE